MESNSLPVNGHGARIDELTRWANSCDARAESQRRAISHTDKAVAVVEGRVTGVEDDVSDIRGMVVEMRDEFRSSKYWLVGAAISFAGLALTAAALIVTVTSGG